MEYFLGSSSLAALGENNIRIFCKSEEGLPFLGGSTTSAKKGHGVIVKRALEGTSYPEVEVLIPGSWKGGGIPN